MGESRRRRQVWQHIHGGPMPPAQKPPEAVVLTILVTPALRDAIDAEFETMDKPKDRPITRQDFLEKLLFGGFSHYMEWKAQQQERGTVVKLATPADIARVAKEDTL
jgi:hypothetical protein